MFITFIVCCRRCTAFICNLRVQEVAHSFRKYLAGSSFLKKYCFVKRLSTMNQCMNQNCEHYSEYSFTQCLLFFWQRTSLVQVHPIVSSYYTKLYTLSSKTKRLWINRLGFHKWCYPKQLQAVGALIDW